MGVFKRRDSFDLRGYYADKRLISFVNKIVVILSVLSYIIFIRSLICHI